MGLFDEVTIQYDLPWPEVQNAIWQSKDTPAQYLEQYELRTDGTLWHEGHEQWEAVLFTGEMECHEFVPHDDRPGGLWYSVQFWLRDGVVKDVAYLKEDTGKPSDGESGGTKQPERNEK